MANYDFRGFMYLTEQQYRTLRTNGSIVISGVTYTYEPKKYVYVTDKLGETAIVMQDLTEDGFTPEDNKYYMHVGETTSSFIDGIIYLYNGEEYKAIDGSGSGGTVTTTDKMEESNTNPVTSGGLYNIFHSKRYW